jgi:hypothetical protein
MTGADLKPGDIVYRSPDLNHYSYGNNKNDGPALEHFEDYRCVVIRGEDGPLYLVDVITEIESPDKERDWRIMTTVREINLGDMFHRTAREAVLACIEENREDARKCEAFIRQLLAILPPA